jgi:hypothetical protein
LTIRIIQKLLSGTQGAARDKMKELYIRKNIEVMGIPPALINQGRD